MYLGPGKFEGEAPLTEARLIPPVMACNASALVPPICTATGVPLPRCTFLCYRIENSVRFPLNGLCINVRLKPPEWKRNDRNYLEGIPLRFYCYSVYGVLLLACLM